jgi:hypothetical protein
MLPRSSLYANAVGFAAITPGAAWTKVDFVGAGGATALTRLDAGGAAAADLAWAVEASVTNRAAAGGDVVYVTCTDPGVGAATLGIPVDPQTVMSLPLYGASTPPAVWVYGAATTPDVTVLVSAVRGQPS